MPSVNQVHYCYPGSWAVLVSAFISARTRDAVTLASSERILAQAPNPRRLSELDIEQIQSLIYPAGFYKTKARNLKKIAFELLEKHNSKVPSNEEALMALPGIGRKTASLIMGVGFGIPAICVDIHVHRISNRTGWIKTDSPEESEKSLQKILPKDKWISLNKILVAFGQNICTPHSPFCSKCPIETGCKKIGVRKNR